MKPTGLRATQIHVLAVVGQIGPARMIELAKALVMDRTTLTRNLRPLLARNLLEVIETDDHRERPIALTGAGRALLDEARPLWRSVQDRVVEGLGRERWDHLLRELGATVRLMRSA